MATTTFMEKMVIEAQQRRLRVVRLRQAGLTYQEIAGAMGLGSRGAACRLYKEAVRKGEVDGHPKAN